MTYTVKQLADLAGVTRRTLHYYDQIGLLDPAEYGENGYRHYDEGDLLRLQQILFYREMGLKLAEIKALLNKPDYDVIQALENHRHGLLGRAERLQGLVHTVDQTIRLLKGEINMSPKDLFEAFDEETQEKYAQEAAQRWDPEVVRASNRRWKSYSKEKQGAIMQEGNAVYAEIVVHIESGPACGPVQDALKRWHQHLRHFYEPTPGMLRGLGMMYEQDPAFAEKFAALHPELPGFLNKAIGIYCEKL